MVPSVSALTVTGKITVNVTIADEGNVVMAQRPVTVRDIDADGVFTVDEVLVAAHDEAYEGGSEAGYASEDYPGWGLSITKLWGNESGSYGFWLNNTSCWSLSDVANDGDYLVAFCYKSLDPWDTYSAFGQHAYNAPEGCEFIISLDIAGYDESWNTVFAPHDGADVKILDTGLKEISKDDYTVTDNQDGTYTVTVAKPGEYFVAAYDDAAVIVPAVASLEIKEKVLTPYDIFTATADYLEDLGTPSVGSVGGEWMVIALARAGRGCPDGYIEAVEAYVKEKIDDAGRLHKGKSTDNSRVILALTSVGYDVTDVCGHDLLMGLTDMNYVKKQGINGPIFALIAFDSHGYKIPQNADAEVQVTREGLISYILGKQLESGGWTQTGTVADVDTTAMALQALAPYYTKNDDVKAAVDSALACLSDMQLEGGGFCSVDGFCSESCAQVIVALTSLGIDPTADERFIKEGKTVVDALCSLTTDGVGFSHVPGDERNGMATEQGEYALAAFFRFMEGDTSLYDMTDVAIPVAHSGDANGDGSVDMKDVLLIRRYIAGLEEIPEEFL